MRKLLMKRLKNQKGLTLIELLAVIVILGIIAAIAVPSIGNIINNSKEDAAEANANMIRNAARLYIVSGKHLPAATGTPSVISLDEDDLKEYMENGVEIQNPWGDSPVSTWSVEIDASTKKPTTVNINYYNSTNAPSAPNKATW